MIERVVVDEGLGAVILVVLHHDAVAIAPPSIPTPFVDELRAIVKKLVKETNNHATPSVWKPVTRKTFTDKVPVVAEELTAATDNDTTLKVRRPIAAVILTDELCTVTQNASAELDDDAALFGIRTPHTQAALIDWRAATIPIKKTITPSNDVTRAL